MDIAIEIISAARQAPATSADCTAVSDLLARLRLAPDLHTAIVITDGIETCRRGGMAPLPPPANGAKVIVMLVPAERTKSSDGDAKAYEERKGAILRAAPWVKVVTPWAVTMETAYHLDQEGLPLPTRK